MKKLPESISMDVIADGKPMPVEIPAGTAITDCDCEPCKALRALVLERYSLDELEDDGQ